MIDRDALRRFVLERTDVRGEWVHLDSTWRAVLERHDYPPVVRALLGEALAAAALLFVTVKLEGTLTLQVRGDGPVRLLVVQANSARTLRGLAHWDGEIADAALHELFGNAQLVITMEPTQGRERYQGVVALDGERLSDALENYFNTSEQLPTRLWLAADGEAAAGLLLQKLPSETDDADAWPRAVQLAATLTGRELLGLDAPTLLRRLYHEEDVRLFGPELFSFRCSCSRERIESVLRGLGYDEVQGILRDEGAIGVNCEFCNQHYEFDRVDAERLFAAAHAPPVSRTRH